jgi:hypothetical protein
MPEGEREEQFAGVQRKPTDAGYFSPRYAATDVSQRLNQRIGAGEPLDGHLRSELSPWFADRLEGVRVHRDAEASSLAGRVAARAFTFGQDVYFASGEYRPESTEGRRVLAHELAHVVQQSGGGVSAAIRRMSAPTRVKQTNVHPWRNEISGDDYEVQTDGGTPLAGWTAYSPWKIEYHYWCHGHSLGTFDDYGYSIYSGTPMRTAVAEEWTPVSSGSVSSGDIAVWLPTYEHSCRIVSPSFASGQIDPNATGVTSKNGMRPLASTTLANVMAAYPRSTPAFFRRR